MVSSFKLLQIILNLAKIYLIDPVVEMKQMPWGEWSSYMIVHAVRYWR